MYRREQLVRETKDERETHLQRMHQSIVGHSAGERPAFSEWRLAAETPELREVCRSFSLVPIVLLL